MYRVSLFLGVKATLVFKEAAQRPNLSNNCRLADICLKLAELLGNLAGLSIKLSGIWPKLQ
jgi:hypothetical protein